ncbi:cytochrome c3 family protein [Mucilaginibacter polytrichastri]|uniref:Uncharacterized protein n=1 Tax=Mucilaginibacter polytrichastri TaxID=1302689 RepID=A0A1Q5ZXY9_9SPHI|nr:hypothetical protein [Mucilaginibacter polytrichastri]OKS86602.1 hypothetical protein RG47T_2058 [Mucilaginibacter polytrichastri]SFS80753.1 hypothetical protein SAMN04487890_104169 [Mucilaginibacter polytrichastri]
MKYQTGKLLIFLSSIAFILIICFSQCIDKHQTKVNVRGQAYADPKSCIKCHSNVYASYTQTGHFHTSKQITGDGLQRDIVADSSTFNFNSQLKINIEKRGTAIYQVAYYNNQKIKEAQFAVAFGSGEKAQTYGYWKGNKLFELPLSYFKIIHNWANSPGFPPNEAYFNREIVSRCFNCHGSYLERKFVQSGSLSVSEEYDKNSVIYGIDCQRCHGPAAEHVNYQAENPQDKQAKFITPYKALTRQQKVDMCSVCHSGNDLKVTRSVFSFRPGDTTTNFYEPNFGFSEEPDVHGNQYNLLKNSKCFANSVTMTCTNCHNSHEKETGNMVNYSQKCMSCHKTEDHNFCKMAPQLGNAINTKCVDCHMPAMPSKVISFKMTDAKNSSPYLLRTHRIAVYPQQTAQVLQMLRKFNKQ